MKQRGQKSAAAKSTNIVDITVANRPRAPEKLPESAKALFNSIVSERDPSYFDATGVSLLGEYCTLQDQLDLLAVQIRRALNGEETVSDFKTLTASQDKSQGRMKAIATALRLTQQARYVPDSTKNRPVATGPKPWET